MVESKSSVVVVAVLFVVVGSGDLGWAALAGCHWLGSAGSAGWLVALLADSWVSE